MASATPVNTVTMHSSDLGVQADPQSHKDISHPLHTGVFTCSTRVKSQQSVCSNKDQEQTISIPGKCE